MEVVCCLLYKAVISSSVFGIGAAAAATVLLSVVVAAATLLLLLFLILLRLPVHPDRVLFYRGLYWNSRHFNFFLHFPGRDLSSRFLVRYIQYVHETTVVFLRSSSSSSSSSNSSSICSERRRRDIDDDTDNDDTDDDDDDKNKIPFACIYQFKKSASGLNMYIDLRQTIVVDIGLVGCCCCCYCCVMILLVPSTHLCLGSDLSIISVQSKEQPYLLFFFFTASLSQLHSSWCTLT